MMPEQKKYPTAYSMSGTWTNPAQALGQEDNLCASINSSQVCNYYLQVKTYGFNIPSNATITGVFIAVKFHRYRNCVAGNLIFYLIPPSRFGKPNQTITADCDNTPPADKCGHSSMSSELDLTSLGSWLPSDFNTEIPAYQGGWETQFRHNGDNLLMESWVDAAYLRVTYTVPTAEVAPGGDGLTWIVSQVASIHAPLLNLFAVSFEKVNRLTVSLVLAFQPVPFLPNNAAVPVSSQLLSGLQLFCEMNIVRRLSSRFRNLFFYSILRGICQKISRWFHSHCLEHVISNRDGDYVDEGLASQFSQLQEKPSSSSRFHRHRSSQSPILASLLFHKNAFFYDMQQYKSMNLHRLDQRYNAQILRLPTFNVTLQSRLGNQPF
jgi:hypothetical protein